MRVRLLVVLAVVLLGGVALRMTLAGGNSSPPALAGAKVPGLKKADAGDDKGRAADRDAVRKSSLEFATAFETGDAKTVAAFWTEEGEYVDDDGSVLRGRESIEKAFAEFFRKYPKSKIEVEIDSIRFLAADTAVEEGFLKLTPGGAALPTTTRYSVLHVRQGGKWRIALSREWGGSEDRLRDLEWLAGDWSFKTDDREVSISFQWNEKKTFLRGRYLVKKDGKTVTGSNQVIGFDPVLGQMRSWMFEDDGGIGYGLWSRDGGEWAVQSSGVKADGTQFSATNTFHRLGNDVFVWRSRDREAGGESLPDTAPVKVTRVKSGK